MVKYFSRVKIDVENALKYALYETILMRQRFYSSKRCFIHYTPLKTIILQPNFIQSHEANHLHVSHGVLGSLRKRFE